MASTPATCSFWLKKKARNCGFPCVPGSAHCSQHTPDSPDFVPCPLDPKHKVHTSKLQHHMTICNKTKSRTLYESLSYYSAGLAVLRPEIPDVTVSFKDWDARRVDALIAKIGEVYERAVVQYTQTTGQELQPVVVPRTQRPDLRQHIQSRVLAEIVENEALLQPDACYIEYGAGKGALSHYISERAGGHSSHYLVERAPIRNKFDKLHKDRFVRLQVDIADLSVSVLGITQRIVGVGKHVCGGATDLSIVSMLRSGLRVEGMALATCCHHRCTLSTYVNVPFLTDLSLSVTDTWELFKATSWGPSGAIRPEDADSVSLLKSEAGLKAKRVIDIGRVLFLCANGFRSRLQQYCDNSLTPENIVLVATAESGQAYAA